MGVPHVFEQTDFEVSGEKSVYATLIQNGKRRLGVDMYVIMHWAFSRHPEYHQSLTFTPGMDCPDVYYDIKSELEYLITQTFSLFLVYDGKTSPFKTAEDDRETRRQNAAAKQKWANAFDIIPYQAWKVWNYVKDLSDITQLIAPFEADPQLAYLYHKNYIDAVLTADSDLIFYQVNDIVFRQAGNVKYYHRYIYNTDTSNARINCLDPYRLFIYPMIIGNDYSRGVPNHGIKKCVDIIKAIDVSAFECPHCSQTNWKGLFSSILSLTKPVAALTDNWQKICYNEWKKIITIYTSYPVFDISSEVVSMTTLRSIGNTTNFMLFDIDYNLPVKDVIPEDKYDLIAHCKIDPNTFLEYK